MGQRKLESLQEVQDNIKKELRPDAQHKQTKREAELLETLAETWDALNKLQQAMRHRAIVASNAGYELKYFLGTPKGGGK